jgi:hypothetical protein
MSTRTRFLLTCGSAALALAAMPATAPVLAASGQVVALSTPRVSVVDAARTVVTFEASGDIRGVLTLNLLNGSGGALTGDWSLVSRYVQDVAGGGDERPQSTDRRGDEPDHNEAIEFVERGTVRGTVVGGALGYDAHGQLYSLDALALQVGGGYVEFAGATGSGDASASNLQDPDSGSGVLNLAMEVAR